MCTPMGRCIQATCANCATCVSAVSTFVQSQQKVTAAADVKANFIAQASQIAAGLTDSMQAAFSADIIANAIGASPAGNLGKKAGSLCMQMQCEY